MRHVIGLVSGLGAGFLLAAAGCTSKGDETPGPGDLATPAPPAVNSLPAFVKGPVVSARYDGTSDDLLTAGFGQSGLPSAAATPADPAHPTAAELRKLTVVNQYRALKDTRPAAGYGTLYGPAVAGPFTRLGADGKVAGREYLAYADDGTGSKNVTMLVQIPSTFDPKQACLVATVSSGSRGVYGAIGTGGEWGLKNGCAVVHTDKGTGSGVHDLDPDTTGGIDGTRGPAANLGERASFRAQGSAQLDLPTFKTRFPQRIAQKHAHSQKNPEAAWGQNVLQSIEFAFYVLNLQENYGQAAESTTLQTLNKDNTLVLAASVSNGGASVLRAAEQDTRGLIDGVVAGEPNVNPRDLGAELGFTIKQWDRSFTKEQLGRPLYDYISYYNVFQPCASATTLIAPGSDPAKGPPMMGGAPAGLAGRCAALRKAGLLTTGTLAEQAAEAQQLLTQFGTLEGSDVIAHPYNANYVYSSIAVTYANAYGRFSVADNLCGYSLAATAADGTVTAKSDAQLATDFALSNGVPPSNGTALINNSGSGGRGQNFRLTKDADGNIDEYLAGALCLRHLYTGTDGVREGTGSPLGGQELANSRRVQAGIREVLASANLHGKPALIVHGRDDALLHPNFTSRAYYGLNQTVEGAASRLSYVEVTHANHLDSLNKAYAIDTQIPLDYYFQAALDRMYEHLRTGKPLPRSQVIPTVPLAATAGASALTRSNLPDFDSAASCPIAFGASTLTIPECKP